MDIPGVPDSIPRSRVLEMLASLGIDPDTLISFRMEHSAIYATVYALNDKGMRYADDGNGGPIATSDIAICITG